MTSKKLKVENWPIDKLIPYARNPRKNDQAVEQVAAAIREFGFRVPIVAKSDGLLVDGHLRLKAAQKLGLTEVPVVLADDMTEAQIKAFRISVNRMAELAQWDNELLALEFAELKELGFDTSLTGFDNDMLAEIMPPEKSEPLTDEDAVPEVEDAPVVKRGDTWILGNHRLRCGDSTSAEDVALLMNGEKAELCFTSPPYSDQREYNGGKELSTKHLAKFISESANFVNYYAVNLGYSRKNNEVFPYWDDYIENAKQSGLRLLSWNIWDRSGFAYTVGQATAMFTIDHEWIFVFGKQSKKLNRTIENKQAGIQKKGTIRQKSGETTAVETFTHSHRQIGTIYRGDVARYVGDEHKHPAMFPVHLPESYYLAMTNENQIVYEPFSGSGTSFIAAEKTGRRCFGMELDEKYVQVIIKRWQEYTGKDAYHAETGETFNSLAAK